MSSYFYDGQVRRFITQFMRLMSGFCYKDAKGQLVQVPVRYGDMNRQVASIVNKNSDNTLQSAPFIACYLKDLKMDRQRLQDPTFVSKVNIRERAIDPDTNQYLNYPGNNYTVERIMPVAYNATFVADIWTTSLDQKLQLWEQIAVLFNPAVEFQSNDNYLDWTNLTTLELLDSSVFESRTIPQGIANDISVSSLQFLAPIWITPPAKVKKLGVITSIISNMFANSSAIDTLENINYSGNVGTVSINIATAFPNFDVVVLNNKASLSKIRMSATEDTWTKVDDVPHPASWLEILDRFPGKFKPGISQLRLKQLDNAEIVAYITLNPQNESEMVLNIDQDTVPSNTMLSDLSNSYIRGTIDAIINPLSFNPTSITENNVDKRFMIINDINPAAHTEYYNGPVAWKGEAGDFVAHANDIIQWDGTQWNIIFDAFDNTNSTIYQTNAYTGIQYKWDGTQWSKSFEGVYESGQWRLIL